MRMLGKVGKPPCGRCCGVHPKVKGFKRSLKRRERQAWKKGVERG